MPQKIIGIIFFSAFLFGLSTNSADALTMPERTSGKILLQVESKGEGWYVYPKDLTRYSMGRPEEALELFRALSLGITNANLAKIPVAGSSQSGDAALRSRLSGLFLLQVESSGEIWYVNPSDLKRYQMRIGVWTTTPPIELEYQRVIKAVGLGISNANLALIPVAGSSLRPGPSGTLLERLTVATTRGNFAIEVLTIDLANPRVKILTDTGDSYDCTDNCTVKSLDAYVGQNGGFAGINGTYFCPKDYASCASQDGSYYWMVYNSRTGKLIHEYQNQFNSGPLVAFDSQQRWHFYLHAKDFPGIAAFAGQYGSNLQAAISNGPALRYEGRNVLNESTLDDKQRTVKSNRSGIGFRGTKVFFIVSHGATVGDLGAIMEAIRMDYAINLDGGGSSAMYFGGYQAGPGRNIPNAIVAVEQ